jgi:hypothetical protein
VAGCNAAGGAGTEVIESCPALRSAMTAAFQSDKFDDYLDRLQQLDRTVVVRYRFYEPEEVLAESDGIVPDSALQDTRDFAAFLIRSGKQVEARGDWKSASKEYWRVARFGQLIDSGARTDLERRTGAELRAMAYRQLRTIYERDGAEAEAGLFGYLTRKLEVTSPRPDADSTFGQETCRRNATVLMVSGLLAPLLLIVFMIAASVLIVARLRSGRAAPQRARPGATIVAMTSAVGLLLSSATIYLTYRPYWYILRRAILNGDISHTRDLREFLTVTHLPSEAASGGALLLSLPLYFWTGLILIAFAGLILSLLRHFRERTPANELPHSPRMP